MGFKYEGIKMKDFRNGGIQTGRDPNMYDLKKNERIILKGF